MAVNDQAPSTLSLAVTGMTCGSCVRRVQTALLGVEGVNGAEVDLRGARATVTFDPSAATPLELVAAVEDAGYPARVATTDAPAALPVREGCGCSSCS